VGVVRYVQELPREAGAPDFFHFYAMACNTRAFTRQTNFFAAGGAATDREKAAAKALGEAVERYCSAIYDQDELPLVARGKARFACVDPRDFALYGEEQYESPGFPYVRFDEDSPVRWVPATDPLTGETCHVPAAMVYVPYAYYAGSGEAPIVQPISTGLACHVSPAEAAVSGICEVIERDAVMLTWLARLAPPQIRVETLSPANYDLVQRFESAGGAVSLFDLRLDIGVPTVLSVLRSRAASAPALVVAASTSLDPEESVRKSLEELAHTRRYSQRIKTCLPHLVPDPPAHENVMGQIDHLNFWCDQAHLPLVDWLFASKRRLDFEELMDLSRATPREDVQVLCEKVQAAGYRVLLSDLTTADIGGLGLSVLRAVVPGLHPLFLGHPVRALGSRRLWELPQELGFAAVSASGPNPLPHPYP
jgi:ribosomal protein S12 methylthiotransferase accessory factor